MRSPVLFLTYRRESTARLVFDEIRAARPPRLYFASNGPPRGEKKTSDDVGKVRQLLEQVDWPCEVHTLFRESHLDVADSLISAITWFFEHESEGIILEDDCLPHPDFFQFCDSLLDRYRHDEKIFAISGSRLMDIETSEASSYSLTRYLHIWGWATWRRTWLSYDRNMAFWPELKGSQRWRKGFSNIGERFYWERKFDATFRGRIRTWDYQLLARMWSRESLAIAPMVNLVSNLGFGQEATFTSDSGHPMANMQSMGILPIRHPKQLEVDEDADKYTFKFAFGGGHLSSPQRLKKATALILNCHRKKQISA